MASALEEMQQGLHQRHRWRSWTAFLIQCRGDTMASECKGKGREAKLLAEQEVGRLEKGIKEHSKFLSWGDWRDDVAICRNRNGQICFVGYEFEGLVLDIKSPLLPKYWAMSWKCGPGACVKGRMGEKLGSEGWSHGRDISEQSMGQSVPKAAFWLSLGWPARTPHPSPIHVHKLICDTELSCWPVKMW